MKILPHLLYTIMLKYYWTQLGAPQLQFFSGDFLQKSTQSHVLSFSHQSLGADHTDIGMHRSVFIIALIN